MRNLPTLFWASVALTIGVPANAATNRFEGQWTTEYQIVDVSNSTVTDPNQIKALKIWVGHKYGGRNCVETNDPSNLLKSAYPWDPRVKSSLKISDHGGFTATNHYFGGFAIPGRGTETVVGVIEGDHLSGIVDIDLDWEGGTHVRAVLSATRSGPCK